MQSPDRRQSVPSTASTSNYSEAAEMKGDGVMSNLRLAFPLPSDGYDGDDRFRMLLEALRRVTPPTG